jgi:hypothetical protein
VQRLQNKKANEKAIVKNSRFEDQFVDETPHPILTGFDRLHDGMFAGVKVFGGMFILGRIATAYVATFAAQAQMNPSVARFQTFFAALGVRLNFLDVAEVRTMFAHPCS